ncbi:hypothetical protein SY88_01630 [Clostridiales bacterium PH28_bin88]|nr:hypothetical protein SY88_01630 [Clostridiales bacterium PH28_bin88]
MVRKTHKGIMGKEMITRSSKPRIGPGIGFQEMDLRTGEEIEKAVKREDRQLPTGERQRGD